MSIGIGMIGRDCTMTIGGEVIPGVQSKGGERANTRLDTTDDQAGGWDQAMAISGSKSITRSFSGVVKNLGLINSYHGVSQAFEIIFTFQDGSIEKGDFFMDTISETGEHNGLLAFDASFSSSGKIDFIPAV